MFGLPHAKRVRRDELDSPSSSRASSPDVDILNKLRANTQFDLIETANVPHHDAPVDAPGDSEDEELAFNLFAPTIKPATASDGTAAIVPQTIRLRSQTPLEDQNQGFTKPERDSTYYFSGPVTATKQTQYDTSAVTGAEVLAMSRLPCPGCAHPWKVIHLPSSAVTPALRANIAATTKFEDTFLPDVDRERKRKRLGKKMRIKKRVRAEKKRARDANAEKSKEEKEKLEKEKRAMKNRKQKLKQRAKAKAAKQGANAGGDAEGGDAGAAKASRSDSDSGDEDN